MYNQNLTQGCTGFYIITNAFVFSDFSAKALQNCLEVVILKKKKKNPILCAQGIFFYLPWKRKRNHLWHHNNPSSFLVLSGAGI